MNERIGDSSPAPCSALVKEAERVLKYLREIGEQTRGESTFQSAEYDDAMADGLEYALKQNNPICLKTHIRDADPGEKDNQ